MRLRSSWLLLLALSMAGPPAAAQVYRWVDANGRTQVSDSPPPSAKGRAEVVTVPSSPPVRKETIDWSEKERELRRRQMERQAAAQPQAEARAKACAEARNKLARWKSMEGSAVYRLNKDGEREYISDEDREGVKRDAQMAVDENCR